jgi:hypothetical protein
MTGDRIPVGCLDGWFPLMTDSDQPALEQYIALLESSEFKAEAHRQSLAVATSPNAAEDQAFVDSISDFWVEEPLADDPTPNP